ncbi:MAG: Type 1 glutamine amidotransferase-like domain-containing protein [candidate division SR1 bacterium]|nr:Type 1 glutamine amidotransferase-like domain-containing protein [candidate division SR1 bacterium]
MTKIIAIGGGEVREKTTLQIDKEIINFSGKKNPKLLFIPTASGDVEGYFEGIKKYFESLGCKVDVLYLIKNTPTKKEIEGKILSSDIIYVGGGNTLKMMSLRRKLGVDKILEKALKKNIVLSGLSAGSICWFKYGNSDSRKFTSESTQLIKVSGLNFIQALHCPHYDVEIHRQEDLKRMMKKSPLVAIAIENDCAIQIENNNYRIITSKKGAKAYKIYWKNNQHFKEEIKQNSKYSPIENLLRK